MIRLDNVRYIRRDHDDQTESVDGARGTIIGIIIGVILWAGIIWLVARCI